MFYFNDFGSLERQCFQIDEHSVGQLTKSCIYVRNGRAYVQPVVRFIHSLYR